MPDGKTAPFDGKKADGVPRRHWAADSKLLKEILTLLAKDGCEVIGKSEFGDPIVAGDMVVRAVAPARGDSVVGASAVRDFRDQCGEHAVLLLATKSTFYCDAAECASESGARPVTLLDAVGIDRFRFWYGPTQSSSDS